jgi:hypothetical protein
MALHLHVIDPQFKIPADALIIRSAEDLIPLSNILLDAQKPSRKDVHVYLADEQLSRLILQLEGGILEIHFSQDVRSLLEQTYGALPSGLTLELAQRWLEPPHSTGISILQLLLSRVLGLRSFEAPSAKIPLTEVIEALVQKENLLQETLVLKAWMECGPSLAVGSDTAPGPLRDPRAAPSVLTLSLLSNYPVALQSALLEATNWQLPRSKGLDTLLSALTPPDPRILGSERLATLATLLKMELENLPIEKYLIFTSGRLKVELDILLERLSREDLKNRISVEDIRLHFDWLLAVDPIAAAQFQSFSDTLTIAAQIEIPQTTAETIEEAQSGLSSWRSFFIHQFLPALAAWRRQGRHKEDILARTLFSADASFAKWISRAYPKLKSLPLPVLAYRELRRLSSTIPEAGPCIILLIDGLAYEMAKLLQKEASEVGISISGTEPLIASLPTVTDIGMLTAVAGLPVETAWPEDYLQAENARKRREELLYQRVPNAVVQSLVQLEQVVEALKIPSDLYVLVWSDIDFLAHRYADPDMFIDYARISLRYILQEIAKAVNNQAHLSKQKERLRLLISADHGWTDLLEEAPVARPKIVGVRPHHRLCEVPRALKPNEIVDVEPNWIAIGGNDYDLPAGRTYLIPIKNRTVERRVSRQHGGLSQCEVFVPLLTGRFIKRPYHDIVLKATTLRPLQKNDKGEIRFVLTNPNWSEVRKVEIVCHDLDLLAKIDYVQAQYTGTYGPFPVTPRLSGYIDSVQIFLDYEGSAISHKVSLLEALSVERSPEERMAGDYSGLESLLQ